MSSAAASRPISAFAPSGPTLAPNRRQLGSQPVGRDPSGGDLAGFPAPAPGVPRAVSTPGVPAPPVSRRPPFARRWLPASSAGGFSDRSRAVRVSSAVRARSFSSPSRVSPRSPLPSRRSAVSARSSGSSVSCSAISASASFFCDRGRVRGLAPHRVVVPRTLGLLAQRKRSSRTRRAVGAIALPVLGRSRASPPAVRRTPATGSPAWAGAVPPTARSISRYPLRFTTIRRARCNVRRTP